MRRRLPLRSLAVATFLAPLVACATGVDTSGPLDDSGSPFDARHDDAWSFPDTGSAGDDAGGDDATTPEGSVPESSTPDSSPHDASPHDGSAADSSTPDSSAADSSTNDAGGDGSVVGPPAVGDLVITEVMFDPSGTEPQSEWIELYNLTATAKLLSGLTMHDGLPRTHVIASNPQVVVPPHAYVVLARDKATAVTNLVPAAAIAYEYGTGLSSGQGIQLANGASGGVSLWNGGTELANVPYGGWGLDSNGHAIELKPLAYAGSDTQANWCQAQNPWTAGSDDGTPGAASDCP